MAVIITTCNRPFTLKDLVEQLKTQLKENDSIIIVNDGDEGSVNLRSENVYVVEQCKDYFAAASARNKGLEAAVDLGFEWGVFIDDDIVLSDNWLKNHRKEWTDKNTIYAGKIVKDSDESKEYRLKNKDDEMTKLRLAKTGGCNFGIHLPALLEDGGYDEDFDGKYGCEDIEILYRLLVKGGWDFEYLPKAKVINLQAPTSSEYSRGATSNREKLKSKVPEKYIWGDF